MGWRFHKSTKMGPFRLNFSKRGIGWSVGAAGVRYTHRADGRRTVTSTIKGTGLSYVTELDKRAPADKLSKAKTNGPRFRKTRIFFGLCLILSGLCCLTPFLAGMTEEIQQVGAGAIVAYMAVSILLGVLLLISARKQPPEE